jgi:hypothetical protein
MIAIEVELGQMSEISDFCWQRCQLITAKVKLGQMSELPISVGSAVSWLLYRSSAVR